MKFITRDTDYALRALLIMAEFLMLEKNKVTIDEIIDEEPLPKRFLRRIFQRLQKNRILCSYKGKDGGFSFLKAPSKIRIIDVVRIFQGDIDITNCLLKGDICPNTGKCILRKRLKGIGRVLIKELEKITIASLLKESIYAKTKGR